MLSLFFLFFFNQTSSTKHTDRIKPLTQNTDEGDESFTWMCFGASLLKNNFSNNKTYLNLVLEIRQGHFQKQTNTLGWKTRSSSSALTESIDTELNESFRRGSTDGDPRAHAGLLLLHAAPRRTVPAVHGWVCTSLGSSSTPHPVSTPYRTCNTTVNMQVNQHAIREQRVGSWAKNITII